MQRGVVRAAMNLISSETCIDFRELLTEKRKRPENFLSLSDRGGCWSYVGRLGGEQAISLGPGCKNPGKASHELMHAIGFIHEHQRSDRDKYVDILLENSRSACGTSGRGPCDGNFRKAPDGLMKNYGRYDFGSVMHYGGYSFSKGNNNFFIIARLYFSADQNEPYDCKETYA